jgi:hypothetical protein
VYSKKEIVLKLRTADICQDCMNLISGKITMPELYHCLNIMGSLREKMLFAQNFKQSSPLSKMMFDHKNRIFLPEFGNIEIKLRPLEKALFILFLQNPTGNLLQQPKRIQRRFVSHLLHDQHNG